MVRSATHPDSVLDTAIGIAARPSPGVELGANDVAVPGSVLAAIGAQAGDVAHVSSESSGVWARLRASREVDQPDAGAFVLRLGRMLWPQLGVKPGQPLSIGRAGALPVATELRLTPPFNLTFKTHERMLTRLREDRTVRDAEGRAKLYADIAHPINSQCREMIQSRVIVEFRTELERAKQPGYASRYDEDYDDDNQDHGEDDDNLSNQNPDSDD